jgi:hypothetical protein
MPKQVHIVDRVRARDHAREQGADLDRRVGRRHRQPLGKQLGQPGLLSQRQHGRQPGARHKIRLVEHRVDHGRVRGQLHRTDALLEPDLEPSASSIVPAQKGIRLSRHADHAVINGGSGLRQPS